MFAIAMTSPDQDNGNTEVYDGYTYTVHRLTRDQALLIGSLRGVGSVWDLLTGKRVQVIHYI